jgi:hypothetical protein
MDRNARKYRELKATLISRGYTLRSWALAHGYKPTTVYGAASGVRAGIKSIRIRKQLEALCGTR